MDLNYWEYPMFDFNNLNEDKCKSELLFGENYNGTKVDTTEALCILLRRLAYTCRFLDITPTFARSVSELSIIFDQTLEFVYEQLSSSSKFQSSMVVITKFTTICKCNTCSRSFGVDRFQRTYFYG